MALRDHSLDDKITATAGKSFCGMAIPVHRLERLLKRLELQSAQYKSGP